MGLIQVRKWIIMMSLLNETTSSTGAIHLVLTRAKACENYVSATLQVKSDQAFLVGLLSGVHLLFGVDTSLFLQQVSVQPEIEKAILGEEGHLGEMLRKIKHVEYAIRQNSALELNREGPEFSAYYEASDWAKTVLMTTNNS
jgi:EAL and modified HD-GYP domain-containing signal transduction protein